MCEFVSEDDALFTEELIQKVIKEPKGPFYDGPEWWK